MQCRASQTRRAKEAECIHAYPVLCRICARARSTDREAGGANRYRGLRRGGVGFTVLYCEGYEGCKKYLDFSSCCRRSVCRGGLRGRVVVGCFVFLWRGRVDLVLSYPIVGDGCGACGDCLLFLCLFNLERVFIWGGLVTVWWSVVSGKCGVDLTLRGEGRGRREEGGREESICIWLSPVL